MRHILHEILSRYLISDQHAFDASPRELWPSAPFEFQPPASGSGGGIAELGAGKRTHRELEPHH